MQKSNLLIKSLSNNTTTKNTQNWRTQIKNTHLISQISSILLQRHNWPSLLQTLNLNSKLTPSIFLQILTTTKTQPQTSLQFFKWAINNTSFQPDLSVQCTMTHLLIGSNLVIPSKPILNSLLQNNPPAQIVQSLFKDSVFFTSKSLAVFDCVLRWYCEKGLCLEALEFFNLTRDLVKYSDGNEPISIGSYNTVLNALQENNEVKMGLCFYGVMIRNRVLVDRFTWRIIAKIFRKEGRVDAMLRIVDMGVDDDPMIYDLLIECCSEMGMFDVALQVFDEMSKRKKLDPGFDTFVSILNGACRYKNDEMIKFAMESMAEKGFVSEPLTEHNSLVRRLCDMKKTYAAHMVFEKACNMQISLKNETYGFVLRALSMDCRVKDAIETYRVIEQKGVKTNPIFYVEFVDVLCNEDPSKEVDSLVTDMISRGFKPSALALSKYITTQCKKRRWKEAEELADLAFQESISLDASCCGCLVKHYCKRSRIDSAVDLHGEIEKKGLSLDSRTYDVFLGGLLGVVRVKEAERIFDYMRMKNMVTSESFVIMIDGFCRENELKKAMKLHDEMLGMGLKPNAKTYKRLISNFR